MLERLAGIVERPAGEVLIGFVLIALGAALSRIGTPHGDEIMVSGLTLISRAMIAGGKVDK
jgi:hypothetical protein